MSSANIFIIIFKGELFGAPTETANMLQHNKQYKLLRDYLMRGLK